MTRGMRACLVAAALAGLAGCGSSGPQEIDPASDACSRCRMSIEQLGHAGEMITADGRVRKYDSLGCLALDHADVMRSGQTPRHVWVVDYATHDWIPAEQALYALAALPTDHMGYGVAAAATRAGALRLVAGDAARVVDWPHLHARIEEMEQRRHE